MKVKDLMDKLKGFDLEATVLVNSSNFEVGFEDIEARYAHQYDTGEKSLKGCFDAFDGESYNKTVWSTVGGNEKVVKIG
jgi:hypothetical protein